MCKRRRSSPHTEITKKLIGAAQQVEHYEIAVYGTLRSWANLLGFYNDAQILESILNEERQPIDG